MCGRRLLTLLLGTCAVIGVANNDASADQPPAQNLATAASPIAITTVPITAGLPADPLPWLNMVPSVHDYSDSRMLKLVLSGCPVDPTKTGAAQVKAATPRSGCPIDPTKVGGAQEVGPGTGAESVYFSRYNFSSPIYWPLQGQLSGYSRVNFESTQNDFDTVIPGTGELSKVGVSKDNEMVIEQEAQYGVTDNLRIGLTLDEEPYNDRQTTRTVPTYRSTSDNNSGWENPTFEVGYLALSQPHDPVFLSFTAEYLPNAFPATTGVSSGAQAFSFASVLADTVGEYTFAFAPSFDYTDLNNDSHPWTEHGTFEFFDNLSDRWSYRIDSGFDISPGPGERPTFAARGTLAYYIVPEKVQATLFYEHAFVGDYGLGANRISDRNSSADVFGIALFYEFDVAPAGR